MKPFKLKRPSWLLLEGEGGSQSRLKYGQQSNTLVFDVEISSVRCHVSKSGRSSPDESFSVLADGQDGNVLVDVVEEAIIFLGHLFGLHVVNEVTVIGNQVRINHEEVSGSAMSAFAREQVENLILMFWEEPVGEAEFVEDPPPETAVNLIESADMWSPREVYYSLARNYPQLEDPPGEVVAICQGEWRYDLYERLRPRWQEAIQGLLEIDGVYGVTLDENGTWAHITSGNEFDLLALQDDVEDAYEAILERLPP